MNFFKSLFGALSQPLPPEREFEFCGIGHPLDLAKLGFLVMGRPRSGKTSIIVILAVSLLPSMKRVLAFDYKNEYAPTFRRLFGPARVTVCAPYEPNSARWAWARDINSLDDADAFASMFAPQPLAGEREPFFAQKAADYFKGVFRSLHLARPNDYDFNDLNYVFSSDAALIECLAQAGEMNARLVDPLRRKEGINRDVKAVIGNRISDFQAVQRRFDTLSDSFTLTDWLHGEGGKVLVVGHSHKNKDATGALTRTLLQRGSDLLLDEPGSETPHSLVLMDELQSAGRLELTDLLSKGGSKGIVSVLGAHSISTLREIYGPDGAAALSSYNSFKCFCGLSDYETARMASDFFGERDDIIIVQSESFSEGPQGGRTRSESEHVLHGPVVTPQQFLAIPPLGRGVTRLGMYVASPIGSYYYDGLTLEAIKRIFPRDEEPPAPQMAWALPPKPPVPTDSARRAELPNNPDESLPYWNAD